MLFTPENKKKFWIGVGVVSTCLLGFLYMRRKKAAAARAAANNGPDGNPIIKGLVYYPTPNYFGARPITQFTSDSAVRVVVPINERKTDALVAVAVVEENVLPADVFASIKSKGVVDEKEIITSILEKRSTEYYNLSSLTPTAKIAVSKKSSSASTGRKPCPFSFTITATGSLASSSSKETTLFIFFKYIEETNSLVELTIDHSLVSDETQVSELAGSVYINPVIESKSASLASTIPWAGLRLVVPASKWDFVSTEGQKSVLQLASEKAFTIPLDTPLSSENNNNKDAPTQQNVIEQLIRTLPQQKQSSSDSSSSLISSQTKMTEQELLASPELVTSVVHKKLGVEFPAVQSASIIEPFYGATESLAFISSSSSSSSSKIMTFERWTDAPEQWWFNNSKGAGSLNANNVAKNANLTKEEIESHFLREVRMMFLPLHVETCGLGARFVSACGHDDAALLEARMDGRRVRFYIFRRQNEQREIIVLRQEADDAKWESEAVPYFRALMDTCLVSN
jgi:hypothetical protein